MEAPRKWYLNQALVSFRRLGEVINDLTIHEITACLDLEVATQRRRSLVERLIARTVQISASEIDERLQEKYLGKRRVAADTEIC